jgi:cytochrome c-type biogenesis protein CcmH/NrfG
MHLIAFLLAGVGVAVAFAALTVAAWLLWQAVTAPEEPEE